MTAAEKYAELEARGEPRPVCKCHGEPMQWDKSHNNGWRCSAKRRAAQRAWRKANPDKAQAASNAWLKANPDKYHARRRAWMERNRDKTRLYGREHWRRKAGWYDEGGMATKPATFKEL